MQILVRAGLIKGLGFSALGKAYTNPLHGEALCPGFKRLESRVKKPQSVCHDITPSCLEISKMILLFAGTSDSGALNPHAQ